MTYLWLPIGLLLPSISGWLALRLLEGKTPVLFRVERMIAGLCVGILLTMFITFVVHTVGIVSLSLLGMLGVQLMTAIALGALYYSKKSTFGPSPIAASSQLLPWQKIATGVFGLWIAAKIVAGFIFLIGPPYYDDVMTNWNMRGKAFFVQQELVLEIEPGKAGGVASYPQAVPLTKTWLAQLNGDWHEGLVNSIHIVWYICALALIFFALRRMLSLPWSLLGVYILSSIPLYSMHGMIAYTDLYLSILLLLSLSFLFFAANNTGEQRASFLKMGALLTGMLVYTKNEALLLHLPPIVLLVVLTMVLGKFTSKEKRSTILWYSGSIASFLIPWLAFKWINGLSFGNAKSISGLDIEWHEGVLRAIGFNTFFEGNWNILPVLFIGLCIAKWRHILYTPLGILVGFVLAVWLGQLPIYMFTSLYIEALNQTGYARGLIHLLPVVVMVTTILLHSILHRKSEEISV
jgi:hypothetical protein